ncbi:two-component regulator propeller domain-containing protein [Dysgonomonas sp. 520]|uniref:two-component regulator propeller domain-containing protein n=1 Tax=Dysgonomonas sp. 520 TaxID=2302931 RepID=UPI0013D4AA9C|nr:two-component regulator propeller domain-containing protein [Dysgonomonas sp. 520]NDW08694.1 hybrid sensor histidine kinase/response regulator [Dysgonomonas sp. 520]
MRLKLWLLSSAFFLVSLCILAQPNCHFEHYGPIDGLPQRSVMSILQDKKGFMWFSTWDGLCKFDGYNFTTYKSRLGDPVLMKTSRIDKIWEDTYGNIWAHSYNKETYKFDPNIEQFRAIKSENNGIFLSSTTIPTSSGKVWITSELMGCVCVLDSTNSTRFFNVENNLLKGNKVNTVFEDKELNSWILTDNGLTRFSHDNKECNTFFSVKQPEKARFFCATEVNDEIWFGGEKGCIFRYQKKNGKFKTLETGVESNIISIKNIFDNVGIILTSNDGFFIYNKEKDELNAYNKSNLPNLPTNELISCYVDKNKDIWIEMDHYGVAKFDVLHSKLTFYTSINPNRSDMAFPPHFLVLEDNSGGIWIHPRGGGFSYYDKQTDQLLPFYNNPLAPNWKFSSLLHDAYFDRQGNLWLSTRSDGLEKIVFDNDFFKFDYIGASSSYSLGYEVRAIFEDRNKNIWLGSKDDIIRIYDQNENFKGILNNDGRIGSTGTPIKGKTYTIIQCKDGTIWIGTKGDGLYLLEPRASEKESFNITHFTNNANDPNSVSSNNIYSLLEDNEGRLWIGTYGGGLNLYDKKNSRFINHQNNLKNYPIDVGHYVRTLEMDKNGNIYVGTTFGLIVFSSKFESFDKASYKVYTRNAFEKNSLSANDIFYIYRTSKNEIFIATFGGGLCKVISKDEQGMPLKFKNYNVTTGLPSDVILTIIEDNDNKLWVSSEGDLTKFDPETESFEIFSDINRIMSRQYFSEAKALKTYQGEIIFGCSKGILSFIPQNITRSDFQPYLALTGFRVSNIDIQLHEKIDAIKELTLTHKDNFFTIEFAALDFVNPQNISYAYRLDGFDKDWIYCQKQRIANYTNLSPGNYVFRVKSTNSNGNWIENEHVLNITIRPSFWQTGWAYSLYITIISLIVFIVLRSVFTYYRMRDRVVLEQEQTEMKTRFFTDISHEIRTPLTMIVSPVENILDNEKIPQEIKPELNLVLKNANRMLNMVNQILDFRKIQKLKLNIQEVAIGEYVAEICNNFFKSAGEQGIQLNVDNQIGGEKIWVDKNSIEKLVFNLVSNSIKYTPKGKNIEVTIFKKDKAIALQVKDEGQGMTKEIQNKLFTRFASFNTDKNKPSTGIGLSIVKEVADKHHAKIAVDSDINRGSSFTILFSPGLEHFENDENVNITYPEKEDILKRPDADASNGNENIELATKENSDLQDKKLSVLLVEDDSDLRGFTRTILAPHYNVLEAENGKDGYNLAIENLPDIILSDIMMPEMDGIEFLRKTRENYNTSHIPFILLTAKTSLDDKLEGISFSADEYITKPFNVKLLKAKINNILEQRRRLVEFISKDNQLVSNPEKAETRITNQDEVFIRKVKEEIEKNLDNNEFMIDDLANVTNMSRKVFFNKMKSLTGLAPVEYVRETRLKHAGELLKNKEYMVKEVAFMVGFSDIKYFTQHFKKMYNMTPGQYKSQFN